MVQRATHVPNIIRPFFFNPLQIFVPSFSHEYLFFLLFLAYERLHFNIIISVFLIVSFILLFVLIVSSHLDYFKVSFFLINFYI